MSDASEPPASDYSATVLVEQSTPYTVSRKPWVKPFINSANARELQAKSCESKRAKAAALLAPDPVQPPEQQTGYIAEQLTIVRAHIARLDAMLRVAKDTRDIDRLTKSLSILRKDERELDGRPLPGAFRPSKARSAAAPSADVV